jgi:hypothetical protein
MRNLLLLLGILLCAASLTAGQANRRVVAACQLTTATVVPYTDEHHPAESRFAVRISNDSPRTIALPSDPAWGWRVDVLDKGNWRTRAEGGPVRRISAKDDHIVVTGNSGSAPLMQIASGHRDTLYAALPEAAAALRPEHQFSRLRLTLYWAAPEALSVAHPELLPCALASEWVVDVQKLDGDPNFGLIPIK